MSAILDDICDLLNSYNGRDKVVRLVCYTAKLYGCIRNEKSWQKAGSQLSSTRMTLRLFDDIPMIRHTYNYGFGSHETSTVASFLGVFGNIVDQIFLPVEKAVWLNDVGILSLNDKTAYQLDTFSTVLWATSLYITLVQTLRFVRQSLWGRACLKQSSEDDGEARRTFDVRLALECVTITKLLLDITHAVSCLPRGYLWGERIGSTKVAAIATTSSVIGISLYFAKKRFLR